MRAMPIMLSLGVLAAAAGAKDTPRNSNYTASVAQITAGLVPGKPQTCLPTRNNADLRADGTRLIYRFGRNLVYVSDTNGGCENVARGDALVTVSPQGRLCSGDIARTVDQASRFQTGSCALGDFTPYTKPDR